MAKNIVGALLGWKGVILFFTLLAILVIPYRIDYRADEYRFTLPYLVYVWANFDGIHYLDVATKGYVPSWLPFFPLYPLVIRYASAITGWMPLITGLVVSHVSFFFALIIMYRIAVIDGIKKNWSLFLLILLCYPTSFSFGAVYNDSLFLLFAVLAVLFARKKHWILAGLAGAFATLTRLNGLAIAVFIALEYLTDKKDTIADTWDMKLWGSRFKEKVFSEQFIRSGILATALIPLVYLAYLAYIQQIFGDWKLIHTAMAAWQQDKVVFPLQVFWRYFKMLTQVSPTLSIYWVAVIELSFAIFYVCVLTWSWKKIRFPYWVYIAISFLIPALTGTFAGFPRYALHLYPFFLSLTLLVKEEKQVGKIVYFAFSLVVAFIVIAFFTRGIFVT